MTGTLEGQRIDVPEKCRTKLFVRNDSTKPVTVTAEWKPGKGEGDLIAQMLRDK
jgi:hypothetical protein